MENYKKISLIILFFIMICVSINSVNATLTYTYTGNTITFKSDGGAWNEPYNKSYHVDGKISNVEKYYNGFDTEYEIYYSKSFIENKKTTGKWIKQNKTHIKRIINQTNTVNGSGMLLITHYESGTSDYLTSYDCGYTEYGEPYNIIKHYEFKKYTEGSKLKVKKLYKNKPVLKGGIVYKNNYVKCYYYDFYTSKYIKTKLKTINFQRKGKYKTLPFKFKGGYYLVRPDGSVIKTYYSYFKSQVDTYMFYYKKISKNKMIVISSRADNYISLYRIKSI